MDRRAGASYMLLLLCAAVLVPKHVHGHASLYTPRPRNWLRVPPASSGPAPWYTFPPLGPAAGQNGYENFGNGIGASGFLPLTGPGVCGDPFQNWAAPDYYASLSNLDIQATYTAGQEIDVQWVIAANHGGRIGLKLCPNGRTGLTQSCFDAYPLQRSDNQGRWYYILEGSAPVGGLAGFLGVRGGRFRLPAGVTCTNGCVLQFEYLTTNTCMPSDITSCPEAVCGVYKQRINFVTRQSTLGDCCVGSSCPRAQLPEIFYNCADIIINPAGPGSSPRPPTLSPSPRPPTPSPTPSPRPSPRPSPSPPCTDANAACTTSWAGLCATNPAVATSCPCTCGSSGGGGGGCTENGACPGWAGAGQCSNPSVLSQCPCSCRTRTAAVAPRRRNRRAGLAPPAPVADPTAQPPAPAAEGLPAIPPVAPVDPVAAADALAAGTAAAAAAAAAAVPGPAVAEEAGAAAAVAAAPAPAVVMP